MTDTVTPLITFITAQDKRALANATGGITFHLNDSQGIIRAHRDGADTSSGFNETHTIHTGASVSDFDRQHIWAEIDCYAAFWSFLGMPQVNDTMRTVLDRITIGSELSLLWVAGNNNQNIDRVGFHKDELRLRITKGKRIETYLLAVSVGPDNTARMIRRIHR